MLGLARKLPEWVQPDHLTIMGLCGALLCGIGFAAANFSDEFLWLACLGLLLNWFGDSLDGNLARLRNIERPKYGFFVDHASDVLSQLLIFLGLGLSPYMRMYTACFFLLSYWLAALFTFIRALTTTIFQISYFGIGPTEIRIALIGYTLLLIAGNYLSFALVIGPFSVLDLVAIIVLVAVIVIFTTLACIEARKIAKTDPMPPRSPQPMQDIASSIGLTLQDTTTS